MRLDMKFEEGTFEFWKHTISNWISLKFIDFSLIHFKNAMGNFLDLLISKMKK